MKWLFVVFGFLGLVTIEAAAQADGAAPKHSRRFVRLDDCEFVSTEYADGDSFLLKTARGDFVFRLYYVDAPESDERFPDRNRDQARYFGITPAECLASGRMAATLVRKALEGKKLTVYTRWSSALGSSRLSRYYAVVEVDGRGLAEVLVGNGLARLHGVSVNQPDGTKAPEYIATLQALESDAKAQKRGAWSNSRPELRDSSIVETAEVMEPSPWPERIGFAGGGAAIAGVAWAWSKRRHRTSRN